MAHPNNDELELLADGELSVESEARVRGQVEACRECADRLERITGAFADADRWLRILDCDVPPVTADQIIARARRRPMRHLATLGAGVAAMLIAVAAAAAPGSPVRALLERALGGTEPVAARPAGQTVQQPSGLAFVPDDSAEVVFLHPQASGSIAIVLGDTVSLRIEHVGPGVSYVLTGTGVRLQNAGSTASYLLTLPRQLVSAHVRVGERTVLTKDGDDIWSLATRDSSGTYLITFANLNRRSQ